MFTVICANPRCYSLTSNLVCGINGIIPPEGWQMKLDPEQKVILYYCGEECKGDQVGRREHESQNTGLVYPG